MLSASFMALTSQFNSVTPKAAGPPTYLGFIIVNKEMVFKIWDSHPEEIDYSFS